MADKFRPRKKDKFAFGVWCVLNRGRDPFGAETRPHIDPVDAVGKLAKAGCYGFEFHDEDLVPFGTPEKERRQIIDRLKKVMQKTGIKATAGTTNLFSQPMFRDGAFTSHDAEVRGFAVGKAMKLIDLSAELGTGVVLLWGGREGAEVDAAKDPVTALGYYRQCVNFLCHYIRDKGYRIQLSIEPKPNEPRGDMYLATTGHALAFIQTLDNPEMVGVNPELAHVKMAGLNPYHEFGQALEAGKLLDVHLNGQKGPRFDQDLSLGSDSLRDVFMVVKLLKDHNYNGTIAFDAHPFRTENDPWDFVDRCMRTYNMLSAKVDELNADAEYQKLMKPLLAQRGPLAKALGGYSAAAVETLQGYDYKVAKMSRSKLPYEKIDQIVSEVLMGVR